jgi:hypothetical protein
MSFSLSGKKLLQVRVYNRKQQYDRDYRQDNEVLLESVNEFWIHKRYCFYVKVYLGFHLEREVLSETLHGSFPLKQSSLLIPFAGECPHF